MQTDADMGGKVRIFRHQALCGAHDEFEMRDVIAILGADNQKFVLMGLPSVQTLSAIKHEYLERRDPVVAGEMFHFINVGGLDRRNVITVIDPEMPLGLLEDFGHEVTIRTAAVEIIVPCAYVVEV